MHRKILRLIGAVVLVIHQYKVYAFTFTHARSHAIRLQYSIEGDNGYNGNFHGDSPNIVDESAPQRHPSSHVVSIKSSNIAGMTNDGDGTPTICIDFGSSESLVAVTGESGSGKSVLVNKAIGLVTGGKAVSSLMPPGKGNGEGNNPTSIELVVNLFEPHLTSISTNLRRLGVDASVLNGKQSRGGHKLHLKRTLISSGSGRLKSMCEINGKQVSLKALRQIASPLFTLVDAGVASSALGQPASRLTMLDMGVPDNLKRSCSRSRDTYKDARKRTERIKRELENRVLPSSLQRNGNGAGFDEEQMDLFQHWIDELDSFEKKISGFQQVLHAQYDELLSQGESDSGNSPIAMKLQKLQKTKWLDGVHSDTEDDSLFMNLIDFREEMRAVEAQIISAQSAYESLASLTAPNSALVALESTRKLLYSICSDDSGPLFDAVEKTHELLNQAESSLDDCARSIDGGSSSLLSTLEKMVFTGVSMEEVDCIIADWNALARKHGISAYSLPNCHMSLRQELDGNVEALTLLPEAEQAESKALENYINACKELSDARKIVASEMSQSVTNLLPSLGLEGSALQIQMSLRPGEFEKPYVGSETIGVDIADFLLLHQKKSNEPDSQRGGSIEQVGSSGEKSRVLLACETALPGSIGSACNSFSNNPESMLSDDYVRVPPIAIVYDEIDAHVGGRAAVTMAKLLSNQSQRKPTSDGTGSAGCGSQIIAITHSASLAAIADRHIVVERGGSSSRTSLVPIRTHVVVGSSRRKEIARMASGDLASEEAETFADALMRDALLEKKTLQS